MNEVERIPQQPVDDAGSILALLTNPQIAPEHRQFLKETYYEMRAKRAYVEYCDARAEMGGKMPIIEKKGTVDRGPGRGKFPYGRWEDVHEQINPVMTAYGFFLEFHTDTKTTPGRIEVTCILRHRAGHSEHTSLDAAPDQSGGKNNIQADISTITYLKRHTAGALLNLAYRGEDDDAVRGGGSGDSATLNEEQIKLIEAKIVEAKANRKLFCDFWAKALKRNISEVSDLPAGQFDAVMRKLEEFTQQQAKKRSGK